MNYFSIELLMFEDFAVGSLLERLKFWWLVHQHQAPFWVSDNSEHLVVDSYNFFTDKVVCRQGFRTGSRSDVTMSRQIFLSYGLRPGWTDKKF